MLKIYTTVWVMLLCLNYPLRTDISKMRWPAIGIYKSICPVSSYITIYLITHPLSDVFKFLLLCIRIKMSFHLQTHIHVCLCVECSDEREWEWMCLSLCSYAYLLTHPAKYNVQNGTGTEILIFICTDLEWTQTILLLAVSFFYCCHYKSETFIVI